MPVRCTHFIEDFRRVIGEGLVKAYDGLQFLFAQRGCVHFVLHIVLSQHFTGAARRGSLSRRCEQIGQAHAVQELNPYAIRNSSYHLCSILGRIDVRAERTLPKWKSDQPAIVLATSLTSAQSGITDFCASETTCPKFL